MSKIIFLDVDGTLVDYQNRLPDSAKQAVQQARRKGHKIYLCTGRSRAEIQSELWAMGVDGLIGGNGSYVEHQGQVLMHQVIPAETAARAVDWLQARRLAFYLESNEGLFASPDFREQGRDAFHRYMASKNDKRAENEKIIDGLLNDMVWGGELKRKDLNKISFILGSYQDHLDSKNAFPELKAGTWGGVGETALFGDLGVANIDKAHAVEVLLQHLNADKADTFAFGDAKIDVPMLNYCAVGVAMGNGGKEVKAAADYITADVAEDGLCKAFQHFALL